MSEWLENEITIKWPDFWNAVELVINNKMLMGEKFDPIHEEFFARAIGFALFVKTKPLPTTTDNNS